MSFGRNLIEDLKQEHKFLVNTLNKVKEIGIGTKEGKDMLFSAKSALLQHLKKEDNFLYPFLREKAQNNQSLKEITDTFSNDMAQISEQVLEFFQK